MADNLLEHIGDLPQVINQKDTDFFEIQSINEAGNPVSSKESRLQLKNSMASSGPVPDMAETKVRDAAGAHDFETGRFYRKGAVIFRLGALYRAKNDFTSGTGFIADDWERVAQSEWGAITGTLADQADLAAALETKLNKEHDYENGVTGLFDHASGGGGYLLEDNNDDSITFIGGNADPANSTKAELYAKNRTTGVGTRIIQTLAKVFYTKNKTDRTVTNGDEVAVSADVADSLAQAKLYTDGKIAQLPKGAYYQGKLNYYGADEAALAEFAPAEGDKALVADVSKIGTYTGGAWILADIPGLQEGYYWLVVDLGEAEKHYQGRVIYNASGGWDINEDRQNMPDGVTLDYAGSTGAVEVADIHAEGVTADDTDFEEIVSGGFHAVLLSVFKKIRGLFALTAGKVNIQQNASGAGKALVIGEDGGVAPGVIPAPLESPDLTGAPTAPTAEAGTDTAQIATTAFVQAAVSAEAGARDEAITGAAGAEAADRDTAISDAVKAVLADEEGSSALPAAGSPLTFASILQTLRNGLKWAINNLPVIAVDTWADVPYTMDSNVTRNKCYVKYNAALNLMRVHFSGDKISTVTLGMTIMTITLPKPISHDFVSVIGFDIISTGRVACVLSIRPNGILNMYPYMTQWTGTVPTYANCQLYGDYIVYLG
jgi:hypothetical protein